jgi:hypothetical protein
LPAGPNYAGTISIPAQGLRDGKLDAIAIKDETLTFSLTPVGATWTTTLAPDGTASDCTLVQAGVTLSCALELVDEAALAAARTPPRPQTPKPPFPYDAVEVDYDNARDDVHLAGTITIPHGEGRHRAVLLISGSGPQDRDESIMGHQPFWVLADHLSRRGIVVLRVDDRGVGGSTGSTAASTGESLARDISSGLEFLRAHERVDSKWVGLIGHSEGGVLGPRVAAADRDVAFVVMMAGTGVPGHEVIREQSVAIARASGADAAAIETLSAQQTAAMDAVLGAKDADEARVALEPILGPGSNAATMLSPWFMDFVRYDPAPALEKLRCPVLVLNGALDLQVLPDQNLPPIRKALARNRRVTIHRLEGLNHLFQQAKTGAPAEYATIEQTIAPEVLDLISDWIVGLDAKANSR